jgi:hypothetical protein
LTSSCDSNLSCTVSCSPNRQKKSIKRNIIDNNNQCETNKISSLNFYQNHCFICHKSFEAENTNIIKKWIFKNNNNSNKIESFMQCDDCFKKTCRSCGQNFKDPNILNESVSRHLLFILDMDNLSK